MMAHALPLWVGGVDCPYNTTPAWILSIIWKHHCEIKGLKKRAGSVRLFLFGFFPYNFPLRTNLL
jgi:hypothetical protein